MKAFTWILPVCLGLGLSGIYLLPQVGETLPSAVKMNLPDRYDGWALKQKPPTDAEIKSLGQGTEFSKAVCLKARPGEFNLEGYVIPDRIDLSIVLSGKDMNTSIHRPERCLPAQGHLIKGSDQVKIKVDNGQSIPTQRLHSTQLIKDPKTGEVTNEIKCLTYYFFIGHDQITNDHYERTFIDMKYRLFKGADQRWAYVSASMWYGDIPWIEEEVSQKEADDKLQMFIAGFAESQIDWSQLSQ